MKHLSFFRIFGAGSMLAVLAGCSASSGVPDKGKLIDTVPKRLTYQTPPTMERALNPENTKAGIVDYPAVVEYPQEIVDNLLAVWDGTKPPSVKVYLTPGTQFGSEDTSQFDTLFLSAGTIKQAKTRWQNNPEAFIFGLAHELAHVLLRHSAAKRQSGKVRNYFFEAEKLASVGFRYAGGGMGDAKSLLWGGQGAKAATQGWFFTKWERNQEATADALAVDLMARAGYALDSGPDILLGNLQADEEEQNKEAWDQAGKAGHVDFDSGPVHLSANSHDAFGSELVGVMNYYRLEHPDAKDRGKAIDAYIRNNAYANVNSPDSLGASYRKWLNSGAVSTYLRDAKNIMAADAALTQKNDAAARSALRQVSVNGRNSVEVSYLEARIAQDAGHTDLALSKLSNVVSRGDDLLSADRMYGELLTQKHRYADAEAFLKEKQEAFADDSFYADRLKNLKASGNSSYSTLEIKLMAQCEAVGEEELEKACVNAQKTSSDNQQKK